MLRGDEPPDVQSPSGEHGELLGRNLIIANLKEDACGFEGTQFHQTQLPETRSMAGLRT